MEKINLEELKLTPEMKAKIIDNETFEEIEQTELKEEEQDLFHTDDEADNEINKELYEKEMVKE